MYQKCLSYLKRGFGVTRWLRPSKSIPASKTLQNSVSRNLRKRSASWASPLKNTSFIGVSCQENPKRSTLWSPLFCWLTGWRFTPIIKGVDCQKLLVSKYFLSPTPLIKGVKVHPLNWGVWVVGVGRAPTTLTLILLRKYRDANGRRIVIHIGSTHSFFWL